MKSASKPPVFRKPPPTPSKPSKSKVKDPVEVYCRLRPLRDPTDSVGAFPVSNTVVQLSPPLNELGFASLPRNAVVKETQFTFKWVFDEKQTQKTVFDHVAKPLVQDLLQGKNGLLFTYGVTGSGKTFTMTGSLQDGGILPRCLDVIFNSIGSLQARKYVFKPDKMNAFDVQSDADAMLDRQKEIIYIPSSTSKTPKKPIYRKPLFEFEERVADESKIDMIDEDTSYAVFIQYIEIYNNYVYDLLEDSPLDTLKPRAPQSRLLREDAAHNMYVHGCTEVEVKNTEEVFEVFYRGQKRRRVAHTTLNAESSRSHSVFTIRLVQIPLDASGREVLQDKSAVCISQLSLVDLAGSERTVRTKNCGERLREAGNINTSLMALRACIEILRENQMQGQNKLVPYRDSKLTHLFKNYFDGEGKVRMIVCINPSSDDYDENIHVMRFAELTQEVQVARPTPTKLDLGLTPGRRKANILFKENMEKLAEIRAEVKPLLDTAAIYSFPHRLSTFNFDIPFPIIDTFDDSTLPNVLQFLAKKAEWRHARRDELKENQMAFRSIFVEHLKDMELLRQQNQNLTTEVKLYTEKLGEKETKLATAEKNNEYLLRRLEKCNKENSLLQLELNDKKAQINADHMEKLKLKVAMDDKLITVREKMTREVAKKVSEKDAHYKARMWAQDERLRCLRDIVSEKWAPGSQGHKRKLPPKEASNSDPKLTEEQERPAVRRRMRSTSPSPERGIPVANPRHRRSRSASELWLDHAPQGTVELGTMLQPSIKRKKSVTKLNAKDILAKETAHYMLTHQEQDDNGDIETSYFKGNVIPSCTGGAQVIFNEVETLKQTSPPGYRKRSADCLKKQSDVSEKVLENRCSTAIEGHNSKKSRP